MRTQLNRRSIEPQYAITDLYDEQRRTFLVQYPTWLVIQLGVGGVIVFIITGFLGYQADNALVREVFLWPWALYLWACAMLWTLQVSILRHPALRGQLVALLSVFFVSVIVVGAGFFFGGEIAQFAVTVRDLSGQSFLHSIQHALQIPLVLAVVNFAILIVFAFDAIIRRVRWVRGRPPAQLDLGRGFDPGADDVPTLLELVAADLLTAGLLLLVLAALVQAASSSGFVQTVNCVESPAATHPAMCQGQLITLQSIDLILAAISFLLAASLLAREVAQGRASDRPTPRWPDDEELPLPLRTLQATVGRRMQRVRVVIHNTVQCVLTRVSAPEFSVNVAIAIRSFVWPALVFLSVVAAAEFAVYIQSYLHSVKSISSIYAYEIPALLWGVVSVMSTVFAPALLLFRWRVAENGLRFLGLVSLTVLLTLWIFSLALFAFNILLVFVGVTTRHPFDPPGLLTFISLGSLLVFGVLLTLRRSRSAPNY